jgi:hypothetical protein
VDIRYAQNENVLVCCDGIPQTDGDPNTVDACLPHAGDDCCFPTVCGQDLIPYVLGLLPPGLVWTFNTHGYTGVIPPQHTDDLICDPNLPEGSPPQRDNKASILLFKALFEEVNRIRDFLCVVLDETEPCGADLTKPLWSSLVPAPNFCNEPPEGYVPELRNYLNAVQVCVYERLSTGVVVNKRLLDDLAAVFCARIDFTEMGLFACIPMCDVILAPDCGEACPPPCDADVLLLPPGVVDPCAPADPCPPCEPRISHFLVNIGPSNECAPTCITPETRPEAAFAAAPHPYKSLPVPSNYGPLVDQFIDLVKRILPLSNCYCYDTSGA